MCVHACRARTCVCDILYMMQDPTGSLLQLAETRGFGNRFHALSLGQGQAPIATRLLLDGVKHVSVFVVCEHVSFLFVSRMSDILPPLL